MQLTFTPTTQSLDVPVTIFNDDIVEGPESFSGVLDNLGEPVNTSPGVATVTIMEDPADSKNTVLLHVPCKNFC